MTTGKCATSWPSSASPPTSAPGAKKRWRSKREAGFRARRWVVERAHSWMNRFRRLLVRWEKKPQNYIAFLHFACGLIAFRAAGLFG
jgi:transposase